MLPSKEEIKEAVWSCDPSKEPRSNGFNMNFVRRTWDVIGADFTKLVLSFFIIGKLNKALNMTWVTLIPNLKVQRK